jgi:hypothetical protein
MPATKRSRTVTEIRSLARSHTRTALNVLVGVMRNTKAPAPARIAAANAILDRGWGKATQAVEGGDGNALELIYRIERVMYDAGKYRLMMKARDTATARAVPPVQRPGMARSAAERDHADLQALSARLSKSGDIRDAVALYKARKSSRR